MLNTELFLLPVPQRYNLKPEERKTEIEDQHCFLCFFEKSIKILTLGKIAF